MPVALWVRRDGEFRVADVNAASSEFSGLTRDKMVGATAAELGDNAARSRRDMLRALSSDAPVTRETPYVVASGEVRQLHVVYVRLGPDELLAFLFDVTEQRVAEARLRVTESRYQALVSAANEGVWLVGPAGRTTFANDRVARMLGRPPSEVRAGSLLDFVVDRDRAVVAAALECPLDVPEAFEARFAHADGRELVCLLSVSPMASEGSPATLCVLADMTALQRERELRLATERQFRRMVETATEGVWTGDPEGRTTFVNEAAARMIGLHPEEIIGRPFTDFVVYDDAAKAVRAELEREQRPMRGDLQLVRADGGMVEVIASLTILRDDQDEIVGSLAMISDVTQMRREQADLRESRERFAQVFDEAPVGMVFIAAGHLIRGRFLGANRAFRQLLGFTEEELLDHDILSVTHPDDVAVEAALSQALFENHRSHYEHEKRFVRQDGEIVWVRFRAHVLRDARGAPLYGLGVAVDISSRKEAFAAAAEAEARTDAVLASTPDAVVEVAEDGTIAELNDAALRMFGFERRVAAGTPIADALVPGRLRARLAEAVREWFAAAAAHRDIESTETTMRRADGSEFPAGVTITPVVAAEPPRLTLYVRNLEVQDRAEAGRREAEERFERLFRDGPAAAILIDLRGRVTDANVAFCTLADRPAAELIGRDAAEILHDADDAHEAPWRTGADRPGPLTAARRVQRADGRALTVQVTVSLVRDSAGAAAHWICQCVPRGLADLPSAPDTDPLSYRERQVLGLLAHGLDGPAVAERLGLSPETVRSYANSARTKTGAKTRTEAVALALARGEITL